MPFSDTNHRRRAVPSAATAPPLGITIYGCADDEAQAFGEIAPRFGVTPTITAAPVTEANVGLARGSRCISVGHKTEVTDTTLLALSRVGVAYASTRSVGCNHIDIAYASRVGITVGTVAYSPDSVADYTVMLILMLLRNVKSTMRRTDAHDYRLNDSRGKEVRDLTVGIVGTGRIGTAVIERLRGFGGRILAHDNRATASAHYVPLEELLARSDIVSLHIPLNPDTHRLLDRWRIEQMRPGALVVNTGRGALVDTNALLSALESGRLAGAALDVLEGEDGRFYTDCRNRLGSEEPLRRLQEMPNVIITPHTAFYTDHALSDVVENTILNCLAFEKEAAACIA